MRFSVVSCCPAPLPPSGECCFVVACLAGGNKLNQFATMPRSWQSTCFEESSASRAPVEQCSEWPHAVPTSVHSRMGPSKKRGTDFITAARCANEPVGSTSSFGRIAARMPLAAVPHPQGSPGLGPGPPSHLPLIPRRCLGSNHLRGTLPTLSVTLDDCCLGMPMCTTSTTLLVPALCNLKKD